MSIEVEDEWDTKTICEIKLVKKPSHNSWKIPGRGKRYTGEHFQQMGNNVIFVVPTDRLLQEKDVEATTYNRFFSIAVHEDVGETLPVFDNYAFNVMVFDEIYMSNIYVLDKGKQFIKDNPDILVIGNG